jgi:hypothetical protein
MKRVVVVGVLLLAGAGLVSAIGFSVGARGGFGIGVGQTTDGLDVQVDGLGNFTGASPIFYSNGYGIKAMAGPEIILLDNLSIELLGGYLFGLEQPVAYFKDMGTDETDDTTATTSFIPVSLTVKLRLPLNRLVLYGGAGPSFGFLAKTKGVEEYNDGAGNLERTEIERTYGIGYGYHGVLGVN